MKTSSPEAFAAILKLFSILPTHFLKDLETKLEGTEPLVAPFGLLDPIYKELQDNRVMAAEAIKLFLQLPELLELFSRVFSQ